VSSGIFHAAEGSSLVELFVSQTITALENGEYLPGFKFELPQGVLN